MLKNLFKATELKAFQANKLLGLKTEFIRGQQLKRNQFLRTLRAEQAEKTFENKKEKSRFYSNAVVEYDREVQNMFNTIFNKQEEGEVQ